MKVDIEMDSRELKADSSFLISDAISYKEKLEKRGVVYISRIPPFMKPNKAKTLFEIYGEVTRIYLAEEDPSARKRRKESGGNSSKQFVEGWVEFSDQKVAKKVADSLNTQPIGSKKGDFYHDDVWNLKYLKNFKWDYLTEKLSYERRVRENKLKAAMLQSKRRNLEFVDLVEKTKVEKHVSERKEQRKRELNSADSLNDVANNAGEVRSKKRRSFKQVKVIAMKHGEDEAKIDNTLLKSIFRR